MPNILTSFGNTNIYEDSLSEDCNMEMTFDGLHMISNKFYESLPKRKYTSFKKVVPFSSDYKTDR